MKFALVIPDGCADERQESLGRKTPLQAARIPAMDEVARQGIVGRANHVPTSLPSGSDVGTMSLFGYNPLKFHTGRAPIEAAAQRIELGPDDWAIRCNFVTIRDKIMRSFTAGQIPSDLGRKLIEQLQQKIVTDGHWQFYPGVSYRNLLIYRSLDGKAPFTSDTMSAPPHDITDKPIGPFLPTGPGAVLLRELMDASQAVLADSVENVSREEAATSIWLWGQGRRPSLELFESRFHVKGGVITAVDLLRGLGLLLGWEVIEVAGATGYLDTNYVGKGKAAIEALENGLDFVVVHVEATDEASHEGNAKEKVKALERIDHDIVAPLHKYLKSQGEYRLLICPDHPTFLRTKTHSHGDVPFAMCGRDIEADGANTYNEIVAANSVVRHALGCQLMEDFFRV